MPQIYTKDNDMNDLSEHLKEALECVRFIFSGEGGDIQTIQSGYGFLHI